MCKRANLPAKVITKLHQYQGSFCKFTQPMRDDVTMLYCLSLAGHIHKMIPAILLFLTQPAVNMAMNKLNN